MSGTIEIFTDNKARDIIDISSALAGVAIYQDLSPDPIEIITGSELHITASDGSEIFTNKLRWPKKLDADIAVVLTDRRITKPNKVTTECSEIGVISPPRASRLAVISTLTSPAVTEEVVAHHLGRLLDVQKFTGNCADANCIMHRSIRTNTHRVPNTSNPVALLRKIVGIPVYKEVTDYYPQTEFCNVCHPVVIKQLGKLSRNDF